MTRRASSHAPHVVPLQHRRGRSFAGARRRALTGLSLLLAWGIACTTDTPGAPEASSRADAGKVEAAPDRENAAPAADTERPDPTLPSAEDLLAAHMKAAGGTEVLAHFQSMYFEGRVEVAKQNLRGTARQWWKAGKYLGEEEIEGVGQSRAGFDGEVAWSDDPIMGLRTLEGREKELYVRSSSLFLDHEWRDHFSNQRTIGKVVVDGRPIYEVELTSNLGQKVVMGFDAETKLLYTTKFTQIGPTGEMPVETYAEDYRDVDGFKFAHVTRLKVPPLMEIVHTFEKVEVNPAIDDARFSMPGAGARVPANPALQERAEPPAAAG